MLALLLKLTLAPGLVALATLAARRAGHGVAGMISGLPVVAGPIVLVFSVQQGDRFATGAAAGAVLGVASLVGYCVAYAGAAQRHSAPVALLAGGAAYGIGTALFDLLNPPLGVSVLITAAAIVAGRRAADGFAHRNPSTPQPVGSDLLAWRVLITVVLVLALTTVAGGLSSHLAGLLTPFPIITSVMAVFTHIRAGAAAAISLLNGLILALISFLAFFGLLAELLRLGSPALAYGAATTGTLLVWAATVAAAGRAGRADRMDSTPRPEPGAPPAAPGLSLRQSASSSRSTN